MKANIYKYKLVIAAIAVILASCEKDFFDTDSPSAMDVSVFKSADMVEQTIGGIYNIFGEQNYRARLVGGYVAMNTDIEWNGQTGEKGSLATYNVSKGTGSVSDATHKDPWSYLNAAVERANVAIDGIEEYSDTTDATIRYLLGEALTLRSYCYLELVKLWGDVPACFKSFDGKDLNDLYVYKTDRNVIFEQLRKDLRRAAELMPWSEECPGKAKNYTGRPSRAAALGLLARMDLMYAGMALRPNTFTIGGTSDCSVQYNIKDAAERQAVYQEAVWACSEIIMHEDKLEPSFEDIWRKLCADETDYSKSEFIWAIPYLDGARGQVLSLCGLKINSTTVAGKMINTVYYGDGKNDTKVQAMIRIVPTFLWDFEDNDKRMAVTVCPFQWEYDNGSGQSSDPSAFPGSTLQKNKLYQKFGKAKDWYLGKYRVEWMKRSYSANEDGIDMPVLRYADVVLMYAEAAIGSMEGNAPTNLYGLNPQEQFDKIRERAGLSSKPLNMENLMAERAYEFCGENIRKYDLMRWNKLGSQLKLTMDRLANMDAGTGEFAGRCDSVYFTYKTSDEDLTQTSDTTYIFDQLIGLRKGDKRPAGFDKKQGWISKSIYEDEGARVLSPETFYLYAEGVDVDMRHYWPIFDVDINASNGTLWNDYGY